jgi:hypothetical protein
MSLVVTVFFAYHVLVLLAWNLPHKHAGKEFYRQLSKYTQAARYFRGTGNVQSWSMFAPNPNRTNAFVRVLVIDESDEVWDMDQDIYRKNRYPYLWYDRLGKVNRRIDGKKGYQNAYGAYICREWERVHGSLPKEVRFVRRSTRIPTPWDSSVRKGPLGLRYEPWDLPVRQSEQERIRCARVKHGQLSPTLRARHGMAPAPAGHFRDVNISTWWDKLERKKKREAREAARTKLPGETNPRVGGSPPPRVQVPEPGLETAPTGPRQDASVTPRPVSR